jgi:hypothetical protein
VTRVTTAVSRAGARKANRTGKLKQVTNVRDAVCSETIVCRVRRGEDDEEDWTLVLFV